ncbi:unnamed protein product [Rotaria socialis]|uniref:Uncharacterized protein n=2 Tax=Rotaria TaxID=231623 RepID=A0A8S2U0Q4_9BILA|nr:unnamed protein product [Rotaria magnacalcarata]CAF4448371.1 unnamed protein product [Rotaria socialis]
MRSKCSTLQIGGKVHISGNGNSPLIINGITYNISSLFNTVAVVDAGIIPVLVSALSQKSYLKDLDRSTPVMLLFQLSSRIFHNIAQVEMLQHNLDKYNCYEILLNVISNANNGLLRAISLLTVARILRDGTYKSTFTIDDSSMLFRLYYESIQSKEHAAHGLKQEHILNGFYAIGRLDCLYHDY